MIFSQISHLHIRQPERVWHLVIMCYSVFTGKNCQQADPCASNPCANGGQCSPFDSHYICICTPFFLGETCKQDVNECAQILSPCKNGGMCVNEVGTYRCNCPAEYTGKHCETLYQPCNPSPCNHGGTCKQIGDTKYECFCLPGRKAWSYSRYGSLYELAKKLTVYGCVSIFLVTFIGYFF